MNKPQRYVILAGLVVVALMLLFPPWRNQSQYLKGLSFVLYPPDPWGFIDLAVLSVEVLFVAVACAALYLYLLWKGDL